MDAAKAQRQLGDAIRRRRLELAFSQDGFADHIEMHRAYYSAIERGERNLTLRLLLKIAGSIAWSRKTVGNAPPMRDVAGAVACWGDPTQPVIGRCGPLWVESDPMILGIENGLW